MNEKKHLKAGGRATAPESEVLTPSEKLTMGQFSKRLKDVGFGPAAEKPVTVVHGTDIIGRYDTIAEAEAVIQGLEEVDPAGVHNGDYSIDAPELLVNPPKVKFTIHQYADISTGYLEDADLTLIQNPDIHGHLAETDDRAGCYWYPASDDETFVAQVHTWRAAGLSDRFIAIMTELHAQGIPYVRFDADGGEIEGLEYGSASVPSRPDWRHPLTGNTFEDEVQFIMGKYKVDRQAAESMAVPAEVEVLQPEVEVRTFDVFAKVRVRVRALAKEDATEHVLRMIETHLTEMLDSPAVVQVGGPVDPVDVTEVP